MVSVGFRDDPNGGQGYMGMGELKQALNLNIVDIKGALVSNPPAGKLKITNIYFDPSSGTIQVEVQTQ